MNYSQILKTIAKQEGCSPKEIEKEMKKALKSAGLSCSPRTFISQAARQIKNQPTT